MGALEKISGKLRALLPGLRGFSATSLKKMRLFYERWNVLDSKSSVITDDLPKLVDIDIYHAISIPNNTEQADFA